MDIVDWLRNNKKAKWDLDKDGDYVRHKITDPFCEAAANEIERLREALEFYANWGAVSVYIDEEIYDDRGDKARAALKDGSDGHS